MEPGARNNSLKLYVAKVTYSALILLYRFSADAVACKNMSMSQDKSTLPDRGRKNYPYYPDALRASCDRCRSKKIKCDGNRPCGACKKSHLRKNNNIARINDAELRTIECVYSSAKKRGPPIKNVEELEKECRRVQDKKRRKNSGEQHPVTGLGQVAREMPSTANHNNMDATLMNPAAFTVDTTVMNPTAFTLDNTLMNPAAFTLDFLQNYQARNPLMPSPLDPMRIAAMQQSVPSSSSGSAVGIQGMTMNQGLGTGATASSRGPHDIMSNASSIATQQLLYMQQAQQQLQLQQFLQQQMQQLPATTERGLTTTGAESPMSSSVEPLSKRGGTTSEKSE
jgi:hypothetical protein